MRTVKGKKRKRIGKLTDKEQSERFIREAKKLGVDESGEAFKKALDRLVPKKPKKNGTS